MADETPVPARTQAEIDALLAKNHSVSLDGISYTRTTVSDRIAIENHEQKKAGHRFGFGRAVLKPPEHF